MWLKVRLNTFDQFLSLFSLVRYVAVQRMGTCVYGQKVLHKIRNSLKILPILILSLVNSKSSRNQRDQKHRLALHRNPMISRLPVSTHPQSIFPTSSKTVQTILYAKPQPRPLNLALPTTGWSI
uniref:Uncharacterized protein n=1 Tax=Cacopsylla melanoneura TaxID=428564 RepID=A0A8D8WUE0_9HEMI